MHPRRIIPCLDVDRGRVVKGVEFKNLRDAGDPVALAAHYEREGADEIVFLDITATHEQRETIVELARRSADEVFIPFAIGGGIRSVEDAQAVLDAGAEKVSVNSAALARPALIDELAARFGAQCVVLAVDARARAGEGGGWEAFVAGGRTPSGTNSGYDLELIGAVSDALAVPVIASGGAGEPAHLLEALRAGADAVLCASIFHYGAHTVPEVKDYLARAGIPIRPA
jgi:cyclase